MTDAPVVEATAGASAGWGSCIRLALPPPLPGFVVAVGVGVGEGAGVTVVFEQDDENDDVNPVGTVEAVWYDQFKL